MGFVDVVVVVESFVDRHDFSEVWRLLLGWMYGLENLIGGRFVPGIGFIIPSKGLLPGVVS